MKKYDIPWKLKFLGNIDEVIVKNITNTLNAEFVKRSNADTCEEWVYEIKRSLDICMPVILTKLDDYKIVTYRDNYNNEFIIQVHM